MAPRPSEIKAKQQGLHFPGFEERREKREERREKREERREKREEITKKAARDPK